MCRVLSLICATAAAAAGGGDARGRRSRCGGAVCFDAAEREVAGADAEGGAESGDRPGGDDQLAGDHDDHVQLLGSYAQERLQGHTLDTIYPNFS